MRSTRLIAFLVVIFSICTTFASRGTEQQQLTLRKSTESSSHLHDMPRSPMKFPVEVYYYTDTNTLAIHLTAPISGTVTLLYNQESFVTSNLTEMSLELPYTVGEYEIVIETESWTAYTNLSL